MSLAGMMKARKAAQLISKGNSEEGLKLYEEAIKAGLDDPRYLLSYTVVLIRNGEHEKARQILVDNQKNPKLTSETKRQLFVNYAACVYKMGELDKAITVLEGQHKKEPSGIIYQTLGYLYIEKGDKEKAISFNKEALEYDDEDSIVLDNLGQVHYRLLDDKQEAYKYFKKAIEVKPSQIDTLYFLAKYDIEKGEKEKALEKLNTALEGRFSPLNYATKESVEELIKSIN